MPEWLEWRLVSILFVVVLLLVVVPALIYLIGRGVSGIYQKPAAQRGKAAPRDAARAAPVSDMVARSED